MKKVQFCCGGNSLEGWENHDLDQDITKPLPHANESVDYILCEHGVEHVTIQEAWNFFEECHRILKPGGVVRIAVPDIERIWFNFSPAYGEAVKAGGHGDGSLRSSIRAAIFEHGHKAAWNQSLLTVILSAVGFKTSPLRPGISRHAELIKVEGHWKVVGHEIANIETSIVEGEKL